MGQAAALWVAVSEIETVASGVRSAVPADWTGRAAEGYQRSAANLGAALDAHAERLRLLAARLHGHEVQVAALRAALASGGMVAV